MNQKLLKGAKWGVGIALLITVGLFAAAASDIRKQTPVDLIYCADDPTPIYRWTCEQFVKHRDLTPAEIAQLNNDAAAVVVTDVRDKELADAIMKRWLEQGVQINAHDQRMKTLPTPLHTAAADGDVKGVELLLHNGADPTIKNAMGLTPLEYVKRSNVGFPDERKKQVIALLERVQAGSLPRPYR